MEVICNNFWVGVVWVIENANWMWGFLLFHQKQWYHKIMFHMHIETNSDQFNMIECHMWLVSFRQGQGYGFKLYIQQEVECFLVNQGHHLRYVLLLQILKDGIQKSTFKQLNWLWKYLTFGLATTTKICNNLYGLLLLYPPPFTEILDPPLLLLGPPGNYHCRVIYPFL